MPRSSPSAQLPLFGSPTKGADAELDRAWTFFASDAAERMGAIIRKATDEVIATPRTRRWTLDQCNDQEKAFVGVNLENLVRAEYDFAEGKAGMDFDVDGVDVDCKWSRKLNGWQIPPEAVGHICLLVHGDDITGEMAVGLLRIREQILVGGNRDSKRTIQSPGGISEIRWLVRPRTPLPENFLMSLRKQDRDAILAPRGGDARALELFTRCEGMILSRHVIESIGQQADEARRFRGETRDRLLKMGFEVLNGARIEQRKRAMELGGIKLASSSQWVCLRTDGSSPARRAAADPARIAEAATYRKTYSEQIARERLAKRHARAEAKAEAAAAALAAALAEVNQADTLLDLLPDDEAVYANQVVKQAEDAAVQAGDQLAA